MAGGLLEPIGTQNLILSDSVQRVLKSAGYNDIKTFDELVGAMVNVLGMNTKVKELSDRFSNLTAADLKSNASTYGLKSGSVEASRLGTRTAVLKREGDQLTYDYNDIIKGVPSDMAVVGSSAVVTGANGSGRTADSGNTGVIKVPSAGSSAKLEVNIQTKKGIITLSSALLVPEEDGEHKITLGVNDYTGSITDIDTAEHLGILSAEVAAIKQKLSG